MIRPIVASLRTASVAFPVAVAITACSSYDIKKDGPLRVTDAWVRAANVTGTGAMYVTLENTDTAAVTILGAGSQFAAAAEFHETTDMQGMSHMTKLDSVPIARGATLTMKPGGLHIMLIDVKTSMAPGDTIPLVLHLGDGRTTTIKAIARENEK